MSPDGSCSISLRSFLEERDPGFGKFSGWFQFFFSQKTQWVLKKLM
jgi:hypothetical protein